MSYTFPDNIEQNGYGIHSKICFYLNLQLIVYTLMFNPNFPKVT